MQRGNGLVQIFSDFSNWSTVAVVPHISNAANKISKIFWIIVFLGVLGMFGYELYIIISKYLAFPAVVNTDILFEKQTFPVVTVCNMNPYKYTVVQSNSDFTNVNQLMNVYKSATVGQYSNDKYGIYTTNNQSYDLDAVAGDSLVLEANLISDASKAPALYTYSDLIQDCTFAGQTCSQSDFTSFIDPVYGQCFSFNENKNLNYSVSRQGIQFGLKLMITVTQQTPDGTVDFLPTTKLAGARIGITGRGMKSELDSNGIDVGVGYESAISITKMENIRAKRPYGRCVDREPSSTDYYQNYTYTLDTCFEGCRQRNTVSKCGCATPRLALGPTDTACQPIQTNINCLQSLKGNQTNSANPNIDLLTECSCNPPCNEITYTPTVSLAKFPANSYFVATSSSTYGSCSSSNNIFSSVTECQDWYSKNGLIIQVYFETISFDQYTEVSGYTLSDIINDLGGQAGLWLGLSFISCIEIAGLLLVMGAFCVTGGGIKISPDDEDMEKDHRIQDVEDVKKELDHMDNKDKLDESDVEDNIDKKEK